MVSEDNINTIIDVIHRKSMTVASNLKFVTKLEVVLIVLIFLFQFWHLRRFLLNKKI
jgi:flagellar biogenesis protein FliO